MKHILSAALAFLFWLAAALVILVIIVNAYIDQQTRSFTYASVAAAPRAETALVLGASVRSSGELSPVLRDRADAALALYKAGKVKNILVSGDNSTVAHNEVNPVRTYLLKAGIPDADIFLDHAGFDTYSTMYRARDIFKVASVTVVTQPFHMPRALFIARSLGLDAVGLDAGGGLVDAKNYLRESLADEKAILDLMLHRKPKYLGDEIPISGVSAQ